MNIDTPKKDPTGFAACMSFDFSEKWMDDHVTPFLKSDAPMAHRLMVFSKMEATYDGCPGIRGPKILKAYLKMLETGDDTEMKFAYAAEAGC